MTRRTIIWQNITLTRLQKGTGKPQKTSWAKTQLQQQLEDGSWIHNSKQMADLFAKHYSRKVKTLQSQRRKKPNIDLVVRLEKALSQRGMSNSRNLPTEYHEPECVTQTQGATFRLQEITVYKLKEFLKQYRGAKQ